MSEKTMLLLAIMAVVVVLVVVFIRSAYKVKTDAWSILQMVGFDYDSRKQNHFIYTHKTKNDPT